MTGQDFWSTTLITCPLLCHKILIFAVRFGTFILKIDQILFRKHVRLNCVSL